MKFGLFLTQLWRKRTTESLVKIRRFWLFDECVENKLINVDLTTRRKTVVNSLISFWVHSQQKFRSFIPYKDGCWARYSRKKVFSISLEWDWGFFLIRSLRISYFSLALILYFPAAVTAVNYFIHHVLTVFNSHETVAR